MELQINDLVSAIKKDGIDSANKEAQAILDEARDKAESIIAEAQAESTKLKADAEKEVKIFEDNARISAEQAKRDATLAFKTEVQAEFEKLLAADTKKALDEKSLAAIILAAVKDEDLSKYAVEIANVTDGLKQQLAEAIKSGLEIKVSKNVGSGFKLAAKDGSGYFDCSEEEITKMLMPFFRDIRL